MQDIAAVLSNVDCDCGVMLMLTTRWPATSRNSRNRRSSVSSFHSKKNFITTQTLLSASTLRYVAAFTVGDKNPESFLGHFHSNCVEFLTCNWAHIVYAYTHKNAYRAFGVFNCSKVIEFLERPSNTVHTAQTIFVEQDASYLQWNAENMLSFEQRNLCKSFQVLVQYMKCAPPTFTLAVNRLVDRSSWLVVADHL